MSSLDKVIFLLLVSLLSFSCEKVEIVFTLDTADTTAQFVSTQGSVEKQDVFSEQQYRHPSLSEEEYIGAINAVKKAYQLTDLSFTPLRPIDYNIGTYQANTTYHGMIYSSVKEIGTYVGSNISFHTFMTAVNNPRSKLYTERIDGFPYHGINCRSYFGVVCSSLVSYALGLVPIYASYDFVDTEEMEQKDLNVIDSLHLADVLWKEGHVAIITNVVRDINDSLVSIEISEAGQSGCSRKSYPRSHFGALIYSFKKVLRYKHLASNINYTPIPQFVPVLGEQAIPFQHFEGICVDKGDRSCYFENEPVVVNCLNDYDRVDIYKNDALFCSIHNRGEDIQLDSLSYGNYQALMIKSSGETESTSWIVVNSDVVSSRDEGIIHFTSKNAFPLVIHYCSMNGDRKYPASTLFCKKVSLEEIEQGYVSIPQDKTNEACRCFVVTFSTEYGNISTLPQIWE